MIAALRDPDPFSKPDTRTERKYHVAHVSGGIGHPACALPLFLLASTAVDAATVDEDRRCRRDRCAMAFEQVTAP